MNDSKQIKYYYTHDNEGRPYKVKIDENNVSVYRQNDSNELDDSMYELKPCFELKVQKVFVGLSPLTKATEFSCGYGPDFDGNSLLFLIKDNLYMFIGDNIYTFETTDEIVKYISPVGNNDVPYPYGIDKSGNYYLVNEHVILLSENSKSEKIEDKMKEHKIDDPYEYYYSSRLITPDRGYIPPKEPIIDLGIDKWYVGKKQWTMNYSNDPITSYDRLTKGKKDKEMYTVDKGGNKTLLTRDGYIKLMDTMGQIIGIKKLEIKEQVLSRDIRGTLFGLLFGLLIGQQ